jgi:hypothetical protein
MDRERRERGSGIAGTLNIGNKGLNGTSSEVSSLGIVRRNVQ